jgi:ParB family chromosome partitioning protein
MSIKDKLLAKTSDLTAPEPSLSGKAPVAALPPAAAAEHAGPRFPPVVPGAAPRTGPGQMLQFRGQMLAVESELASLRERLQAHEGALPTRKLDAGNVLPSRWANRHADSFANADFLGLKHDIERAGGNVQPISVRPLAEQPGRYELIFGHRRLRACAELRLPVLAMIDTTPMTDAELFSAMDRENRERADLSPFEQGTMYRRALDEKLYPSNRRLAESLGVSHTWVANVLLVADLPSPVVACFRSPLDIQHRHARVIGAALAQDRPGVLRRAEEVREQASALAPAAVVAALLGTTAARTAPLSGAVTVSGRPVGRWARDKSGNLSLQLQAAELAEVDPALLLAAIARLLSPG